MADQKDSSGSDVLRQIVSAVLKTPGNIVGGGVDLSNTVLGLLTGKGLGGFVDKPVGGSKQVNEAAGLSDKSGGITEDSLSAILGLLSPAGAAKSVAGGVTAGAALLGTMAALSKNAPKGAKIAGPMAKQRGVIGPATDVLGLNSAQEAAIKARLRAGEDPNKVLAETGAFNYGPRDETLRANIDDSQARLNLLSGLFTPNSVNNSLVGARLFKDYKLSDVLDHPQLFSIFPDIKDVKVGGQLGSFGGGSYTGGNEPRIALGSQKETDMDLMLSTLLHEVTHAVQGWTGLARGTNPRAVLGVPDGDMLKIKDSIREKLKESDKYMKLNPSQIETKVNNLLRDELNTVRKAEDEAYKGYRRTLGEIDASYTELLYKNPGMASMHPLDALATTEPSIFSGAATPLRDRTSKSLVKLDPALQQLLSDYSSLVSSPKP